MRKSTEKDMECARVACLSMRTWAVPPEDQYAIRCMVAQAIADERERVLGEMDAWVAAMTVQNSMDAEDPDNREECLGVAECLILLKSKLKTMAGDG